MSRHSMILGIDEVSKMPVLGNITVCAVCVPKWTHFNPEIKDSKLLTPKKRKELFQEITSKYQYETFDITPEMIDDKILNLNDREAEAMASLIRYFVSREEIGKIYIDLFDRKKEKLLERLKKFGIDIDKFKWVVEFRADEKYKVVSCASIVAKVLNDRQMKALDQRYRIGSGSPGDPRTEKFIKEHIDELEKFAFVRRSWSTIERLRKELQDEGTQGLS